MGELFYVNSSPKSGHETAIDQNHDVSWYEEVIDDDLKWSFALNSVLHRGVSDYQDIALIDTKHFGKALVIDGKMQSAEVDEFIYHECLIHPPLLCHPKAELEKRNERFDIIVGDLADPVEGGPCYKLYTQSFYKNILKPKLNEDGIFVTQAGPADVMAYTTHVPSFADTWGWIMASDQPLFIGAEEMDKRIEARINGELFYLDGNWFHSSTTMNKTLSLSLLSETHVYTEENARFIPGHGLAYGL
ncbi:hypothetical protein TanjilG_09853 [Lupinus angustifolius]|uniref:PABS domain-containing protein n=1 Tax=Lupinus angustifolius TaxID=3871 RepID=A0A4P1QWN2_LUPAN|nr:hypothetical protein TanjilG_09853 [Lupinus angustifolius]